MLKFCQDVAGEKRGRQFFPLAATIFLYIVVSAWIGLLPGFGSIVVNLGNGIKVPLFREAATDINTPLALAIISFFAIEYFGLKAHGVNYINQFINFGPLFRSLKQMLTGDPAFKASGLFLGLMNIFVSILETLSRFVRIVSFTFRLFGNMTAGEILILIATFVIPWVFAIPFYGLEILVGFVQALVFSGLTLIFGTIAVQEQEEI